MVSWLPAGHHGVDDGGDGVDDGGDGVDHPTFVAGFVPG